MTKPIDLAEFLEMRAKAEKLYPEEAQKAL